MDQTSEFTVESTQTERNLSDAEAASPSVEPAIPPQESAVPQDAQRNDEVHRLLEELRAEQAELASGMRRIVSHHEEGTHKDILSRVEQTVCEILESISYSNSNRPESPTANDADGEFSTTADPGEVAVADANDDSSSWESIKRQFLSDDSAPENDSAAAGTSSEHQTAKWIDPPGNIDPQEDDPAVMHSAVTERNDYITNLIQRLRAEERRHTITTEQLAELASEPVELTLVIQEAETRLDEMLRFTEVELSLERARLARVAAELQQREMILEQRARQLGFRRPADVESGDVSEHASDRKARRWLEILGIGS